MASGVSKKFGPIQPEEIPILQTGKVNFTSGRAQILITPIFDDKKKLVRRVKTRAATDEVVVPAFSIEALNRRIAEKEFLLFPCYDYAILEPRSVKLLTEFEKQHKMWAVPPKEFNENNKHIGYSFSKAFCERIRKAATGVEGINIKKIDSRIFRRTCARELILKYGYEQAAAVIRDDVGTLRKHYANLTASDISTER